MVGLFLSEHTEASENGRIATSELYSVYSDCTKANGLQAIQQTHIHDGHPPPLLDKAHRRGWARGHRDCQKKLKRRKQQSLRSLRTLVGLVYEVSVAYVGSGDVINQSLMIYSLLSVETATVVLLSG